MVVLGLMSPREVAEKSVDRAGGEVAGGKDIAAEEFVDLLAGFLSVEVVLVFFGVEVTEAHVVGGWGHLAAAAIGEEKHTRAGAVLVNGHSGSPERLKFGCRGNPRGKNRGRTSLQNKGDIWGWRFQVDCWLLGAGEESGRRTTAS